MALSLMLDGCTDATGVMGTIGATQPGLSDMAAIISSVTCMAAQVEVMGWAEYSTEPKECTLTCRRLTLR